ncbi:MULTISPECIES: hypothetical protein [unclassified Chryseobacterium]|uniref:hypothetical protein n=1 Tax=unclassified Chryseobacterium TaxID=2593645 RepID=UPI00100AAA4C|nr:MULTISPECIES: hypothetical protein [unclassified Chryseobacterium]RXM53139.1 hypothetical protein BOQ64_01710 [Chryseobacterium sp. CH25]RXM65667.1 hypothetical protein BOQ60_07795 [Chryseobacterium sp. CH1]
MNKENLKENIETCIVNLQRLAMINCWNKISPNYVFIVSDFNEFERLNFFEQRKVRNKVNKSKTILSLDSVIEILNKEYQDLYDINFYIFKATKKETVIEIQYYRKSNLDADYFEIVKNEEPMFHSKVSKPYYAKDNNKFDVNWELCGVRYFWNHFIAQIRYRINI